MWDRDPIYSRGVRQKLYKLSKEGGWREKHRIFILGPEEASGHQYSHLLSRSIFCLVATGQRLSCPIAAVLSPPGDGWSARAEDAVLHGCIPLIVMDNVHAVFESILELDDFSVRIKESAVEDIPSILGAFTGEQVTF